MASSTVRAPIPPDAVPGSPDGGPACRAGCGPGASGHAVDRALGWPPGDSARAGLPAYRTTLHRTAPHTTTPHRAAPHRVGPHRTRRAASGRTHTTGPHRAAPHLTASDRTAHSAHHTPPTSPRQPRRVVRSWSSSWRGPAAGRFWERPVSVGGGCHGGGGFRAELVAAVGCSTALTCCDASLFEHVDESRRCGFTGVTLEPVFECR